MAGVLGGHLVGMSTTLEAIAAREAGMEVLGISLVTNLAAGISSEPLNHEEVLVAGPLRGDPDGRPARPAGPAAVRVLVTGAAGSIGQVVTVGLTDRGHEVVALDRVPAPEGSALTWHTGDCADADFVAAVFDAQSVDGEPVEGVVHLAGHPDEASLPDSILSHTVTTAALLDAMVEHGVRRFVYAGSNHAVGRTPRTRDAEITVDHRPRPDTFYGVAKVAAEAVMSLYADRYGLDVVSCRIGSFRAEPSTMRHLSTWLSHDDCVRMVEASPDRSGAGLRGALRHLPQHPRLVGPRPGPRPRLRPSGRRGDVLVR